MPVFISYRHLDREKAIEIANRLHANDIKYYLDVIDEESKSTDDITYVITKNIKKSTHLLAVISPNTNGSWWVPFEIGEATISNRRICSYAYKQYTYISRTLLNNYKNFLPEYLHKWPMLLSDADLDAFIQQYKRDNPLLESGISLESRSTEFASLNKSGADKFHDELKRKL